MMACKNSMWISMDLKKVNLSLPISFSFSFLINFFPNDLYVYLHKVELSQKNKNKKLGSFLFFLCGYFLLIRLILCSNCVDHMKIFLGFLINP